MMVHEVQHMTLKDERQTDAWEQWQWLWNAIFYASVLASFIVAWLGDDPPGARWRMGLLTAALLLWHAVGMRLAHRGLTTWEERPGARLAVMVGDVALWFLLVTLSPAYYIALFGLFLMAFRHLPMRYALIACGLLVAATVVEQLAGAPLALTDPVIWLFLLMVMVSIVLGFWISAIIAQSAQRRALLEQLQATQAELAEARRHEGILEERQRLAREIHDTLAQGFTSIVMHLEAAEQALGSDPAALHRHLDRARSTARASLAQARRVIHDLRPELLERQSLPEALDRTAARWQEDNQIYITATTTGTPIVLAPEIEVTLLRATQEALANIARHARASTVQVTLSYMADLVMLDIQDDGVGLEGAQPAPLSGGFGLHAMRERVAACGGTLTLESEPGDGTTVVIAIPLNGADEPPAHALPAA